MPHLSAFLPLSSLFFFLFVNCSVFMYALRVHARWNISFLFTVSPSSYTLCSSRFVSTLLYASIIKHLCPSIVPRTTIQYLLKDSLEFLLGTYISIYVYPPIYIYRLFFTHLYIITLLNPPSHPSPIHPDLSFFLFRSAFPLFVELFICLSKVSI